jgi:hypothetical protein
VNKLQVACAAVVIQTTAFAHGGTVQLRREAGDLSITVFTSPAPLSVGRADISVLVQNRKALEPILDADVWLFFHKEISNSDFQVHATRTQAQNKLLYAAPVIFSQSGKWHVGVVVSRNGRETGVGGTLDISTAPPRAAAYAGYITFPPAMIVLFVIRERLMSRKS